MRVGGDCRLLIIHVPLVIQSLTALLEHLDFEDCQDCTPMNKSGGTSTLLLCLYMHS